MGNTSHHHGHRQRLRDRFLKAGFDGFAPHEVVELLLTLAIPRRDVKPQAKALLEEFGSLANILDAPIEELEKVPGVGRTAAVALKVIKEATALYLQERMKQTGRPVTKRELIEMWTMRLSGLKHEVFEVAFLDMGNQLMKVMRLNEGTVDRVAVYPRRIVEEALRIGAASIVLAHNHPGGDPDLSPSDQKLTEVIRQACKLVDIEVLEHIVIPGSDNPTLSKSA
ncbi:MAG: DNA repair protein RadC [Deltaproteobacteria bacterium]|nr:DNA repair protein RadC [Deltaproteobacteria bacterium]